MLVYNAGAIYWASVANTPLERFQLMQRVNPEGLYAAVQSCLPHFSAVRGDSAADDDSDDAARARAAAGRIIVVSPPIYSRFFRGKTAYAMGKVGMSVLTKGLAMDFARDGAADMAICSIWPAVVRLHHPLVFFPHLIPPLLLLFCLDLISVFISIYQVLYDQGGFLLPKQRPYLL